MTNALSNLKVFICCHEDDNLPAKKLSNRLEAEGAKTWLNESVLPGQEKQLATYKYMRDSDAVIVCVSSQAMEKAGNIHKEIKYAMDIQEEKPRGTIFFIPLRLEPCEIPFHLKHLEWSDYFVSDGFLKLVKALEARASQLNRLTRSAPPTSDMPIYKDTANLLNPDNPEQSTSAIEVNSYINKFRLLSKLKGEGVKEELIEEYERKLLDQILQNQIKFIER